MVLITRGCDGAHRGSGEWLDAGAGSTSGGRNPTMAERRQTSWEGRSSDRGCNCYFTSNGILDCDTTTYVTSL